MASNESFENRRLFCLLTQAFVFTVKTEGVPPGKIAKTEIVQFLAESSRAVGGSPVLFFNLPHPPLAPSRSMNPTDRQCVGSERSPYVPPAKLMAPF